MMKIINPATMSRAFQLAATSAAAMTVITAAMFLASSLGPSIFFQKEDRPPGRTAYLFVCDFGRLGGLLIYAAQRHCVELLVCRFLLFEVLL